MPMREVENIDELMGLVGEEVSITDWFEITQDRIDQFAEVTEDRQWIHTDPERCRIESPFGVPIAHGFLTLSLLPYFDHMSFRLKQNFRLVVNYGIKKLRFMAAVPAGSRIRVRKKLLKVFEVRGGWQIDAKITIEVEGQKNPACVLQTATRYLT